VLQVAWGAPGKQREAQEADERDGFHGAHLSRRIAASRHIEALPAVRDNRVQDGWRRNVADGDFFRKRPRQPPGTRAAAMTSKAYSDCVFGNEAAASDVVRDRHQDECDDLQQNHDGVRGLDALAQCRRSETRGSRDSPSMAGRSHR